MYPYPYQALYMEGLDIRPLKVGTFPITTLPHFCSLLCPIFDTLSSLFSHKCEQNSLHVVEISSYLNKKPRSWKGWEELETYPDL